VHVIFCRIRDARLARKIKHQQVTTRAGNSTVADVIAKPHCARNARAVVRDGGKVCRARNSEFDFAAADAVENSRRSGAAAKRMAATGPIVPSMRQTPNQPGVSPQPRGRKSALAARVNHGLRPPGARSCGSKPRTVSLPAGKAFASAQAPGLGERIFRPGAAAAPRTRRRYRAKTSEYWGLETVAFSPQSVEKQCAAVRKSPSNLKVPCWIIMLLQKVIGTARIWG